MIVKATITVITKCLKLKSAKSYLDQLAVCVRIRLPFLKALYEAAEEEVVSPPGSMSFSAPIV